MAVRSSAASLDVIGAIADWTAAMIAAASSWPGVAAGSVLTLGPRLSMTLGLRLSTACVPGGSFFFGWEVGEGSTRRGGLIGIGGLAGIAVLPLGVAAGEGAFFSSPGGFTFCFLGVVGSVLGADPETVRFTPLSVPLGGPCRGWDDVWASGGGHLGCFPL